MLRRKRLSLEQLSVATEQLQNFALEMEPSTPRHWFVAVLPLAVKYSLTVYDAAYLELAQRRKLPLATLDDALRVAARKMKVKLI